jgi:hypothetical protein
MTAATLLNPLRGRGIELGVIGDRLRYRPAKAVAPGLRADLAVHKNELVALLTAGGSSPPLPSAPAGVAVAAAVGEVFDGGDVQVLDQGPAVGARLGDEQAALGEGDEVGVADDVRLPAGRDHAEGLEGVAVEQVSDGIPGAHGHSIAPACPGVPVGDAERTEPTIPYIPPEQRDALDQAAIDRLHGRRASWTPPPATFEIPPLERAAWTATHRGAAGNEGVPAGWSAAGWIHRLRSLADACQAVNPGLAARHRAAADRLADAA